MSRSYEQMVELVRGWSNRDREALPDEIIQDCLRWAADKAYRTLRVPPLEQTVTYSMEQLVAATSSTNNRFSSVTELAIPEDLIEFIQIRGIDAEGRTTRMFNEKADVRTFNDLYAEKYNDQAFWTRQGNCILLAPGFGNGGTNFGSTGVLAETGVELYYYRRLPALNARYSGNAANANAIVGANTADIFTLNGDLTDTQSTFIDSILSTNPNNPDYAEVEATQVQLQTTVNYPAIPEVTEMRSPTVTGSGATAEIMLPNRIEDPRTNIILGPNQSLMPQTFTSMDFATQYPDVVTTSPVAPIRLTSPTEERTELTVTMVVGSSYTPAPNPGAAGATQITGALAVGQPIFIGFFVDRAAEPNFSSENWSDYGLRVNTDRPTDNAPATSDIISSVLNRFQISPNVPFRDADGDALPYRFTGPHAAGLISNTQFIFASTTNSGNAAHVSMIESQAHLDLINAQLAGLRADFPAQELSQMVRRDAMAVYDLDDSVENEISLTLPVTVQLNASLDTTGYRIVANGANAGNVGNQIRTALGMLNQFSVTFPEIPEDSEQQNFGDPIYAFYDPGTFIPPGTNAGVVVNGPESRWVRGRYTPHWLRQQNERVLLMGALAEVFFYLQEDDQAQKYAGLFAAEIAELNDEDVRRNASGGNVQVNFNGRGMI